MSMNAHSKELLFLEPQLKERLWGGEKLTTQFPYQGNGQNLPIGESWNISAHPNGDCMIKNGTHKGKTLSEVYQHNRELFGNITSDEFPLLVKIIDAKDDLSIQVHPDDVYAREKENSPYGKTECWYVMDCPENAALVIGHNAETEEELRKMVAENRYDELIHQVPVKKGDMIQINPGTIHAIKGGLLILETQQSSDITYRVYDYNRLENGKPRPLHVEQSLDVIKVPDKMEMLSDESSSDEIVPSKANQLILLNKCFYYKVWKLNVSGEVDIELDEPFVNVVVLEGSGSIDGVALSKGDSFIVPYQYGKMILSGDMEVIFSSIG